MTTEMKTRKTLGIVRIVAVAVVAVLTVIATLGLFGVVTIPDPVIRICGIMDLIALPVAVFTSVRLGLLRSRKDA